MITGAFLDVEALVKAWLGTTAVAALVTRPGGGLNIFQAAPTGAPVPAIIVNRVGGAPLVRSDLPTDIARISFDVWAATRSAAVEIASTLAAEVANLAERGGYVAGSARLEAAEVASWHWFPDPESDLPRYIVDARFVAVPA